MRTGCIINNKIMKKRINKKIDLLVVIGMVIIAILLVIYFKVRFLTSIILFFVIPAFYLLIRRRPRNIKRILIASFLFGILFSFTFDFLAEFNNAWSWSPTDELIFPKIFGIVPIDVIIWFFFWIFLIVVFYEHFVEHDRSDKISPHFKYAFYPAIAALIWVLVIFFVNSELLKFEYTYLGLGLCTLIPFIVLVIRKPALLRKFVRVSAFFIFLYLAFELTSLKLGQWHFPGQYIGTVELFSLKFPFEEFFFWILMSSTIVLAYYELFIDDEK